MEENKLITVIIPVYNVEKYLDRCMKSVLNQTYKNLEIILVDDGAKDNSGKMCDEYAATDSRVKVIHKQNGGLSSARNAALDIARGDYIGFVDSDDYIHPRMYEKLFKAACDTGSDIVICGHFIEKDNKIQIEIPVVDEVKIFRKEEALSKLIDDSFIKNYAWDKLYKAENFKGVRYPNGRNYEDIATTYLTFDRAEKICRIPEYLYYYQMRSDSISGKTDDLKWYKNVQQIVVSKKERGIYFKEQGYAALYEKALVESVEINLEAQKWAYHYKDNKKAEELNVELLKLRAELEGIATCPEKYKKLLPVYADKRKYSYYKPLKKIYVNISELPKKVGRRLDSNYDFTLPESRKKRFVIFELPCFDNLGDHAIAYAQRKAVEELVVRDPEAELYVVDSWQTIRAINALKKVIQKEDVIFLQGGGNFGDLYDFAQIFRKKVMKSFAQNKILMFPQTFYFSDTDKGRRELEDCKDYFSKCESLTLLARDQVSFDRMKENFKNNKVYKACDVVSTLDMREYAADKREGILFCIRSDKESKLEAEEHRRLLEACEAVAEQVDVSDTCLQRNVEQEERENVLIEKWKQFGRHRLVVTDRLHGMIFSMITGTPCVILGNNHHKVEETYKTFSSCEYLHYAASIDEACEMIQKYYDQAQETLEYSPIKYDLKQWLAED